MSSLIAKLFEHNHVVSGVLLGLGVVLIIIYAVMDQHLASTVAINSSIGKSLQGIYTIGVIAMSFGLMHAFGKCDVSSKLGGKVLSGVLMALGLTLLGLSAALVNQLPTGTARHLAVTVLVLSILFIIACGGKMYLSFVAPALSGSKYQFSYGCNLNPYT